MPDAYKIVIEKNEPITLRDGTVTYADVYRPSAGPTHAGGGDTHSV